MNKFFNFHKSKQMATLNFTTTSYHPEAEGRDTTASTGQWVGFIIFVLLCFCCCCLCCHPIVLVFNNEAKKKKGHKSTKNKSAKKVKDTEQTGKQDDSKQVKKSTKGTASTKKKTKNSIKMKKSINTKRSIKKKKSVPKNTLADASSSIPLVDNITLSNLKKNVKASTTPSAKRSKKSISSSTKGKMLLSTAKVTLAAFDGPSKSSKPLTVSKKDSVKPLSTAFTKSIGSFNSAAGAGGKVTTKVVKEPAVTVSKVPRAKSSTCKSNKLKSKGSSVMKKV